MKTELSLAFFAMLLLVSCSKSSLDNSGDAVLPENERQYMTITLSPQLDVDVDSTELLTKGTPTNDVYGINIYYSPDNVTYSKLSYGIFDNLEDMKVNLLSGYYYKFECTLVKNAKTSLYNTIDNFYYPFQLGSSLYSTLSNKFVDDASNNLSGISSGNTHMTMQEVPTADNYTSYASVDRYYGELSGYFPQSSGAVTIQLKRVVFGLKFKVSGLEPGAGTLNISLGNIKLSTEEDCETEAGMYTFGGAFLKTAWEADQCNLPFTFSYVLNTGSFANVGSWTGVQSSVWTQSVAIKRNYLTTLNMNMDFGSGEFIINVENTLIEDNYIDMEKGDNGFIGVVVKPETE